ncbi:amidohydrolase family protein [Spongiactinospora sp. TRM90649]|uniref:amidohydrolase family protein n=1 Tax=Spongiactinospora sp. TRM90649 TaxID=3031114 RepID=UPI0023F971CD|nr:amidohydrolase family protein [Spongiactinospora sp. TRM90649]MDF5756942.1 amidohydrolase family protein [Spongiactinospora sp. TRM90649]
MIIDIHAHVSAPIELAAYKASLLSHRGAHGRGKVGASDDQIRAAMEEPSRFFGGISHLAHLDDAGIDLQVLSPRPFQAMHSEEPAKLVRWYTEETNDIIHRVCQAYPGRFRGMAGLPQSPSLDPREWTHELRRCVGELGFVGAMLNPDPMEGTSPPKPPLGDRYWYPVYEVLCELDVPALVHSAGCRPPARESYSLHFIVEETINTISLINSQVFKDFPDLKLIMSHGGGAVPYQAGRFMPGALRRPEDGTFTDRLRRLYFDSCLYTQDALELLLRTVGADRCLFGSEKPGTGSARNPETGRWFDDIHLLIEDIGWLSGDERADLLENNARKLFGGLDD